MSRSLTSFSLSVVALFATVAMGTANAKECKTDSDCASGFECILGAKIEPTTGGSSGSVGGGPNTGSVGSGANTGSVGTGSAGVGNATGAACAGPDCPVSSPPAPVPRSLPPAPADGGASVPQADPMPRPIPDGGAIIGIPVPSADAGPAMPVVTTGICRFKTVVCTSKADCPANLDCVKQTVATSRPTCAPNTTCDTLLPPPVETGTCKAVCNVDSDCPSPLVCKLQGQSCSGGASVSSDGKVTTMPTTCTGGNKICSYEAVTCSTDTECKDANYQCVKVSEYGSCTGSTAPAGCLQTKGAPDEACPATPAEPPVCTTVVVNNCLPREIKCDAGQACPAGWTCFDFSNFDTVVVPGWNGSPYGKTCLPDGFVMGIYGYASGGGISSTAGYGRDGSGTSGPVDLDGSKGGSSGTPVTNPGDSTPPEVKPVPQSDDQEHASAGDAGTEPAATKLRGGGCSLGGAQDGTFGLGLTLALAGLVLRLVRRRR